MDSPVKRLALFPLSFRRRRFALLALAVLLPAAAVHASGFPPFAFSDGATVARGDSVAVLDTGAASVLANDFDFEGDTLTAVLVENVSHGTLTLNPDGTFLYVHSGFSQGNDRFRYQAFDGTRFSRAVDVRITVVAAPGPPRITGQRNISMDEDESRVITLQDIFVEGGSGQLQLWVGDGADYSVTGATVIPEPDFNGTLNVPLRVTDDNGEDSNIFHAEVLVRPVNDPPFVVGQVPDQIAEEGELFELDLAPYFGDVDTDDGLVFSAAGLPPSRSLAIDRATGVLSGTPQLSDARDLPFDVTVTAEDDGRRTAALTFRLTVFPGNQADLELSLTVQPKPATFGDVPSWDFRVENLGPGELSEGTLAAAWFSSEGPVTLTLTMGTGCSLTGNGTQQPELACPLGALPALSAATFAVQSAHAAPGDTHVSAWVTGDVLRPENNLAASSLNMPLGYGEGPAQNLAVSASDVASADMNGDGYVDLLVAGMDLVVYFNSGERTLTTPGLVLGAGGETSSVVPIDWNADGLMDVAVAHGDVRTGQIYLNDGAGGFSQATALPVSGVLAMLGADLDGNGQDELVVSSTAGTESIRNGGQGQPQISFIGSAVARHISAADLDLDGWSDLVLTDAATRTVSVLRNGGAGSSFTETPVGTGSAASVNTADVDGDGAPDLLVAADGTDMNVPVSRVLKNQLDGSFTDVASVGASPATELFAADVSGDGLADLISINETGVHQVYFGDALGGFALAEEQILGGGALRGHLVDINHDSSLDLILAGTTADTVGVLANDGRGRFGPGDTSAPVITLIGSTEIQIDVGSVFTDPGATASDDIDGDLTSEILVSNPLNPELIGTYSITYAVADHSGNLGQAVRTVQVAAVTEGGGGGGATDLFLAALLVGLAALRRDYSGTR